MEFWVLIPIAGIAAGVISEWLKLRAKQQQLRSSSNELEKTIADLKKTVEVQQERLQNLETIVVSQTWDVLHDREMPPAARDRRLEATVRHEVKDPDADDRNRQRAEQLARRLQG
ncbi:MAG TPA: hypothetical protein VMW27_03040 [Thermoanaerobaculia bacterium]|nr:hypothetical protein [Thermoanaerobaculia bacterium]